VKRGSYARHRLRHPSAGEARASAARIVDVLQLLVIARPEMIIPLEEIVRGILANLHAYAEQQMWQREDATHAGRRAPLPRMPLSDLPALRALLEPPAAKRVTRTRTTRPREKRKRR